MKISVIIPFFNNHKTLPKTLESLSKQSLKVFEIILIDDCSKNQKELEKIVDKYSRDLPLRLLKNTQNSNGAYSRNKGILASKGDVVAFSDADDIWLPNKIIQAIQKMSEVNACTYFGSFYPWDHKKISYFNIENKYTNYLHLFGNLSPGFTFSFTSIAFLKIQKIINEKFEHLGELRWHDWLLYFIVKEHKLQFQLRSKKLVNKKADVFLVDTFGETNIFYNISPVIFMGKSLEHHYTKSGQNPIEPARLGCKILHGPNIENFRDVYKFLKKIGITNQVNNKKELYSYLLKYL